MEKITIPFKEMTPLEEGFGYQFDGVILGEDATSDLLSFHGIPQTLLNIDKKFGTHTVKDVLCTFESGSADVITDGTNIQVLDPRNQFCDDATFDRYVDDLSGYGNVEVLGDDPFRKVAVLTLDASEGDSFLGDDYHREVRIDRLPQGGVNLETGSLRLACTNSLLIRDNQFCALTRNGELGESALDNFVVNAANLSLNDYFTQVFTVDGKPFTLSVGDFIGMRNLIAKMTDPDTAALYFPDHVIVDAYAAQGIDIKKMRNDVLQRLPSGLTYYTGMQFFTNAAKQVENITLDQQMTIASWCDKAWINNLKKAEVVYKSAPVWDPEVVATLMGDR